MATFPVKVTAPVKVPAASCRVRSKSPDTELRVIAPFEAIVLSLPRVIAPVKLAAVALLLVNAPARPIPVPLSVTASATPVCPFRSSAAPVPVTVVTPPVVPSPAASPSFTVPALIVVAPAYVFAPESNRVPAPALVKPPLVMTALMARSSAAVPLATVNVRVPVLRSIVPLLIADPPLAIVTVASPEVLTLPSRSNLPATAASESSVRVLPLDISKPVPPEFNFNTPPVAPPCTVFVPPVITM